MSSDDWLIGERRDSADTRLICLPHAGGQPEVFAHWAEALPSTVEVMTVHLPGRGRRSREPAIGDRARLIPALGPVIDESMADGRPTVLVGHSMGAVLAFEVCRWLADEGRPRPRAMVAVAHRAPSVPLARVPVHAGPSDALLAELHRLEGTPEAVLASRELMALYLPAIRADYAVAETWLPGAGVVVDVPLIALGGWEDPDVAPAAIEAWRGHTDAAFDWSMCEGDHFFLHDRPLAIWHRIRRMRLRSPGPIGAFRASQTTAEEPR